jgi:uncharacterized protein
VIRVVIDTNVVVSALIASTGNEALLLLAITQNLLRPCYSDGIFEEYAEVLRRPKFGFSSNEVQAVLRLLREHGSLVNPSSWPRVSVDPEDDKFIACASAAKAHFLVTGSSSFKHTHSQQNVCVVCATPIDRSHRWCAECSQKNSTAELAEGAKLGRVIACGELAQARRRETKRLHDEARTRWSPKDNPSWLTEEMFVAHIQARLSEASLSQIAAAIGVSIPYASDIRKGRRKPHRRHWLALATLVNYPEATTPRGV